MSLRSRKWRSPWLYLFLPLPLLLATFRFVLSFDGLYGQDSFAYYSFALAELRPAFGHFLEWPSFFWPPGYPVLIVLASYLVGVKPLAGQLVSLVASALVPIFTALLARELWPDDKRIALLAGVLAAGVGQLWQSGIVVMSDTPSLAFATAGMWMVARYGKQQNFGRLFAATVLMSVAVLSRWAYPLVAIPCTIFTLLQMRKLTRANALRHTALAATTVIVVLSPIWLAFLQQKMHAATGSIAYAGDLAVYGWNPLTALERVHETSDGILRYRLPNGIYYATLPAHPVFFTPFLAVFALPGLIRAWRQFTLATGLLALAWIGIVIVFHVGAPHQNIRFGLVYLPPAALLIATGIVEVERLLRASSSPRVSQIGRIALGLLVVFGFGRMLLNGQRNLTEFTERFNEQQRIAEWADEQLPDSATVLAFGLTATLDHYATADVIELFSLTTADVASIAAETSPLYLMLDPEQVQSQWINRPPGQNYNWLRENSNLNPMGSRDRFTLWEVKPKR